MMGGNSGRFPVWRARDVESACACAGVLVGVSRCLSRFAAAITQSARASTSNQSINDRRLASMIGMHASSLLRISLCMLTTSCAIGSRGVQTRHHLISAHCTVPPTPHTFHQHHHVITCIFLPPPVARPGTSAACICSAASRLPTMTQMAHLSLRASWTSVNFVRKTVVAECRQRPSSSIIITLRRLEPQGNDSRRLQLSDAPPKLYPTCYPLAVGLVHRARDTVESGIPRTPDSALEQSHRFLALHQECIHKQDPTAVDGLCAHRLNGARQSHYCF